MIMQATCWKIVNLSQEVRLYILSPEAASSSFNGSVVTVNNNLLKAGKTYMPGLLLPGSHFTLRMAFSKWKKNMQVLQVRIRCLPLQVYSVEIYGNIIYIIRQTGRDQLIHYLSYALLWPSFWPWIHGRISRYPQLYLIKTFPFNKQEHRNLWML